MAEDDNEREERHPALKNFNRTAFMVKHTLWKTLKWAAVGAAVLGAAAIGCGIAGVIIGAPITVPLAFVGGPILAAVHAIGSAIAPAWTAAVTSEVGGSIGGFALNTALKIIGVGAATGGILGAVFAMTDASEAADQEEERMISRYERNEARQERMAALEQRRDQQRFAMERQTASLGLRPNAPMGRRSPSRNQPAL